MENPRRKIIITKNKLIIFILIVLLTIFSIIFYVNSNPMLKQAEKIENMTFEKKENLFFTHEIIRYYSRTEIKKFEPNRTIEKLGINVDDWYIDFGRMPQGYFGHKTINLTNSKTEPYRIRVYALGNISELIYFGKNDFFIKSGENIQLHVDMKTDMDTKPGNYTGEIDVVISIPKNWISKKFRRLV